LRVELVSEISKKLEIFSINWQSSSALSTLPKLPKELPQNLKGFAIPGIHMLVDQAILINRVVRRTVEMDLRLPRQTERSLHRPIRFDYVVIDLLHIMKIEIDMSEKQAPMKPQRPVNHAVA
jgi:hypothetical protein